MSWYKLGVAYICVTIVALVSISYARACDENEDDLTDYEFFVEITFDGPNGLKFVKNRDYKR